MCTGKGYFTIFPCDGKVLNQVQYPNTQKATLDSLFVNGENIHTSCIMNVNSIGTETLITSQIHFPADNSTKKTPDCASSDSGPTDREMNCDMYIHYLQRCNSR